MTTSVGVYEFNPKDLIGHGAFAVVYKGRVKSVSTHKRIRDKHPGSRIRIFSIPDPGSKLFRISRIRIEEFKYFNQKNCF
jgi:hypothetical protein